MQITRNCTAHTLEKSVPAAVALVRALALMPVPGSSSFSTRACWAISSCVGLTTSALTAVGHASPPRDLSARRRRSRGTRKASVLPDPAMRCGGRGANDCMVCQAGQQCRHKEGRGLAGPHGCAICMNERGGDKLIKTATGQISRGSVALWHCALMCAGGMEVRMVPRSRLRAELWQHVYVQCHFWFYCQSITGGLQK